jgi:hypothetical protein
MQGETFLKIMAGLLALVMGYMLITLEIPVMKHGGTASEVVSFSDSPVRFIGIFAMLAVVEWLIVKKLRSL